MSKALSVAHVWITDGKTKLMLKSYPMNICLYQPFYISQFFMILIHIWIILSNVTWLDMWCQLLFPDNEFNAMVSIMFILLIYFLTSR